MSFWENVTGVRTSPAPGPQSYPQAPAPGYPVQPFQQPGYPQIPQQQYQPPGLPDPEQERVNASMRKAQSSRSTATCPECGSGNIFKPNGIPNAMEQCYHCGWNPRFAQSTAGAGMPSTAEAGPARPTRQIDRGVNNFNPQTIVATVGV